VPFPSELTVMPLTDEAGSVTHFVGTLRRAGRLGAREHSPPYNASLADSAVAAAFRAHPSAVGRAPAAAAAGQADLDVLMASRADVEGDGSPRLPPSPGRSRDGLLSRESFPLHTLNNHPIAPVLLRMLQVIARQRRLPDSPCPRSACEAPAQRL
jgi:hypothetical protein